MNIKKLYYDKTTNIYFVALDEDDRFIYGYDLLRNSYYKTGWHKSTLSSHFTNPLENIPEHILKIMNDPFLELDYFKT